MLIMWPSGLDFLDLTDASEEESALLHKILYTRNPSKKYPKLPWRTQLDPVQSPAEWGPSYAVAPIPHPTLRGVFLPPPMYAPAPPALGLVPTVAAPADPTDGSSIPASLDGDSCSNTVQNAASSVVEETVPQESHSAGTGVHASSSVFEPPVMAMPPQIPATVPSQPSVITTMYHVPSVYVSNVTANVNVHPYMGNPYYSVYTSELPHESAPANVRNGRGRVRSKPNNKREGQYDRISASRHNQEVIQTQATPVVDSPPTVNSNMQPQNYPLYPINTMPPPYAAQYYNTATSHLPHHPSPQHGTPIYIPGHPPAMFPQALYGTYAAHQAGAPIMAYPMQSGPVPTTENSVDSSGTEEPAPNKVTELNEVNVHHSQKQSIVYTGETVQHMCDVVVSEQNNVKPTSYQQQQSEEDDYSQANIVNTVVVSNSNIVSFSDTARNSGDENRSRNLPPSLGHQSLPKDTIPPSFVPEKQASNSDLGDTGVLLHQAPRPNVGDVNESVNTVVNDVSVKKEKTVTLSSGGIQHDKAHVDIQVSVSSDVLVSAKPAVGPSTTENVAFTNMSGASGGVQNVTTVASASQPTDLPTPQAPMPTTSSSKSWASLFRSSNSSGEPAGMMMTGASVSGVPGSTKPLACVKPFQNAVTVNSDPSRRLSEVQATPVTSRVTTPPSSVSGGKSFPVVPSTSPAEDPFLYRLGEFLVKYQLDHKTLSLQPRGLTNRGNWCYINSTLQALLACPPFYNLMKSLQIPLSARRTTKSTTPIIDSMVKFVSEFMPLSAASRPKDRKEKAVRKDDGSIEDQSGSAFEPNYIYKMLNNIRSDAFKVEGRQEDAEEFLGCLLNGLNDEMLELIKLVEEPTTKSTLSNGDIATNGDTSAQSQDEDDTEWKVMGPKNKGSITRRADFGRTPISDIFRGQLRSRVQRAGDQSTDNVQPFFTLQLDIEKSQSVREALELLVGKDQLEGVTCSRTNQEVEAWQQVTLEELPLVLLLHLKWFDYKMDGASKILKVVEFPIDLKVDQKLMSSTKKSPPKQRQYKLFAVVYHDGKEATKGHYVTDVYHVGYGGWVRYDDSVVKAVQESTVLHPKVPRVPYLLYYRRCDTIGTNQPPSAPDKVR